MKKCKTFQWTACSKILFYKVEKFSRRNAIFYVMITGDENRKIETENVKIRYQ